MWLCMQRSAQSMTCCQLARTGTFTRWGMARHGARCCPSAASKRLGRTTPRACCSSQTGVPPRCSWLAIAPTLAGIQRLAVRCCPSRHSKLRCGASGRRGCMRIVIQASPHWAPAKSGPLVCVKLKTCRHPAQGPQLQQQQHPDTHPAVSTSVHHPTPHFVRWGLLVCR